MAFSVIMVLHTKVKIIILEYLCFRVVYLIFVAVVCSVFYSKLSSA